MSQHPPPTEFAPAVRAPIEKVREQHHFFVGKHGRVLFDALPNMVLALNCHRQVVFANQAAVSFLGHSDVGELIGLRPGEALGCVNADEHGGGCGTSRHCRNCGAVAAMLAAIEGESARNECELLRRVDNVLEHLSLQVHAAPFSVDGQPFILCSFNDISHQMRFTSMARIFFHDVLNLAGGIRGMAEILGELVPPEFQNDMRILHTATESLVEEIMAQRDMVLAENNELRLHVTSFSSRDILRRQQEFSAHTPVALARSIVVAPDSADVAVAADARLVQRVLGNMLKNALEATPEGGTAVLSCREDGGDVVFSVHNQGHIPQAVQDSIFRRTFSTKGEGRGMGTYSMLLLAERYLSGSVSFRSTEADGTTFFLRLPKQAPPAPDLSASVSG